mmetsp:Transcript_15876/g.20352  ORF Transcript_15876/g.20352 Transcript_15876/m.20352 type:complete len:352 (+) Transcript_15876:124-1179(+)
MAEDNWCTIESDPGVFTELIEKFGVKGVQVEELYTLEDSDFERINPIYGLIFLFKWQKEDDDRPTVTFEEEPELFFANQVINNACATQAILAVLLNTADIDLGTTLTEFKSFTQEFPPDLKGMAISNSDIIRSTHNSFSRAEPFVMESVKATKDDDVYHFVAYIPHNDKVFELDGLKKGPIVLGAPEEGKTWLDIARPAIQERILKYSQSEIRFNLLGLVKNRKLASEEAIQRHQKHIMMINASLGEESSAESVTLDADDAFEVEGGDAAAKEAQRGAEQAAIADLEATIQEEEAKFAQWKEENIRRRHNYIPLVVSLLKVLAEKNLLSTLAENGKKRSVERINAQKAAQK